MKEWLAGSTHLLPLSYHNVGDQRGESDITEKVNVILLRKWKWYYWESESDITEKVKVTLLRKWKWFYLESESDIHEKVKVLCLNLIDLNYRCWRGSEPAVLEAHVPFSYDNACDAVSISESA